MNLNSCVAFCGKRAKQIKKLSLGAKDVVRYFLLVDAEPYFMPHTSAT